MSLPGFETTKEAAERLGVTDSRIRQLAISGRIHAIKIGTMWFVADDAVIEDRRKKRIQKKVQNH
jgi:excisionase family DNA binding protein